MLPTDQSRAPSYENDRLLRWRTSFAWLAFMGALFGTHRLAMGYPDQVERIYARGIFPPLQRGISGLCSLWPVSVSESLLLFLIVWSALRVFGGLSSWRRRRRRLRNLIGSGLQKVLRFCALLYLWFLLAWGVNYARSPMADLFSFDVRPAAASELHALCDELLDEVVLLRRQLDEDAFGVPVLVGGEAALEQAIEVAWERSAELYPLLAGGAPLIRRALISRWMTAAGITGIYSPFTGEGHVNSGPPALTFPFTASHEGAHARGFAREDEANFVAFLVCRSALDPYVRYSGYLLTYQSARSALRRVSMTLRRELDKRCSSAVRRDLKAMNDFWARPRSRVERKVWEVAIKSNDTFLKVQGQKDGVHSYGRVVNLLLAERRARGVDAVPEGQED